MFSSTSFAGWTKVSKNMSGDTYYVDFERMRKHDGFVYYWQLTDYIKPTNYSHLSSKIYAQGDCKLFRYKYLSLSFHNESMGGGSDDTNTLKQDWTYPSPNATTEFVLKSVCSR